MNVEQLVPRELRATHDRHRAHFHSHPSKRSMGSGLRLFAEHEDGTMFPVEISLSPITLDGELHTIASVRDVSDRQEALAHVALLKDRERIARDLHDMVIQRLFAAGMSLQAVAGMIEPASLSRRVLGVTDELDDTIRELRSAIFNLGQPDIAQSLSSYLAQVVDERTRQLGFTPTLTFVGDIDDVAEHVGEQLVATLIEALSNVARHAGATAADIRLIKDRGQVTLEVTDNGVGISASPKPRGGVSNMMWRAAELGGSCTVASGTAGGTELVWKVPA
jgi:signal transduction histidine kinase